MQQTLLKLSVNWTKNILYHLDGRWLKCHNFWLFTCFNNVLLHGTHTRIHSFSYGMSDLVNQHQVKVHS
jgi:hypothetical protein